MKWPTLLAVILLWESGIACVPKPPPYPEAPARTGLTIQGTSESLLLRPSGAVRTRFIVTDSQGMPVAGQAVSFALQTDDQSDPPAVLSISAAVTDAEGGVDLQVIARQLAAGVESVPALLVAATDGAEPSFTEVLVSVNTYSVRVVPRVDEQALGINKVVTVRLTPFDRTTCADLNLLNLSRSSYPSRDVSLGSDTLIQGLSQSRMYAIVAIGRDKNGVRRIGGCVDLPGSRLQAGEPVRTSVFLDRLLPTLGGTYRLNSTFAFSPPLAAGKSVQALWRQFTACPMDPARLIIDCTLDAFSGNTSADPLDCVPMPDKEGGIAALLTRRRGISAFSLSGDGPVPECHDATDAEGKTSLELQVDSLFTNTRKQLVASDLAALPKEIQGLLSSIQVDSTLGVSPSPLPSLYQLEHSLLSISFPGASRSVSVPVRGLTATNTSVSGLWGTHRAEQLSIPQHAFTLRLGTAAKIAFQKSSMRTRGFPSDADLVKSVYEWAETNSNGALLQGCEAIDKVLCESVNLARGCAYDACLRGMSGLSESLRTGFDVLDGPGYDFTLLAGSIAVLDLDNDGIADSLGSVTTPGRWTANFRTGDNASSQTQGEWIGTLPPGQSN